MAEREPVPNYSAPVTYKQNTTESGQCVCRSLLSFVLFLTSTDDPEGNGAKDRNHYGLCLLWRAPCFSVFMPERHLARDPTGVTSLHSCFPTMEATQRTNFIVISTCSTTTIVMGTVAGKGP
jgi:hypothetical protein